MSGWCREVADSLHLRRFCEIGLAGRVPDESTLRKLVHRLGRERVEAITLKVIDLSAAETGFRPRAARSTRRSSRLMSATRPTPASPTTVSCCWRARRGGWRRSRGLTRRGFGTVGGARRGVCVGSVVR
ncbi:MAG: transposase [Solirubrobacteraceae bacterium]